MGEPRIVSNHEFRRNKRKLMQLERENYDKIIFLERSGEKGVDKDWREISEHSALMYYYLICEPLGEQINFREDTNSYYERYHIGLICMNGLTKARMLIKKSGLFGSEKQEGEFRVIKLNQEFSPKLISELEEKELRRRKEENEIIKVSFVDPELYISLRETAERIYRTCTEKISRLGRDTIGKDMAELAVKSLMNYQKMCLVQNSDEKRKLMFWQEIHRDTRDLAYMVQTAVAVKVLNGGHAVTISDSVKRTLKKIEFHYTKLTKGVKTNVTN